MSSVTGIHHITAISGDAQENLNFYVGVLGLRLVKKSINQDAPDTYHLFFADAEGHPGTDITFFPWPGMPAGRLGPGVWGEVQLSIPEGTLDFWQARLTHHGLSVGEQELRFGEPTLPFADPHGMRLALVEAPLYDGFRFTPWEDSPIEADKQIRALAGVRLPEHNSTPTRNFLVGALGMQRLAEEAGGTRYGIGGGEAGRRVDLRDEREAPSGRWGVGAVHHVAWRVKDEAHQSELRAKIVGEGVTPTPVIDRFWFKSVYVREPGGALFEVATDGPGFAVDEDPAHLGETLVLPPSFEAQRTQIEALLPQLGPPGNGGV